MKGHHTIQSFLQKHYQNQNRVTSIVTTVIRLRVKMKKVLSVLFVSILLFLSNSFHRDGLRNFKFMLKKDPEDITKNTEIHWTKRSEMDELSCFPSCY